MTELASVPPEQCYTYIVVRKDHSHGKRAAMVAHAAFAAGAKEASTVRQFVVVLLVADEDALEAFAVQYGVGEARAAVLYFDPDLQEHTAFVAWGLHGEGRAAFKHLPLWRDT